MERRWSDEFTKGTKRQIKKEQKHRCAVCHQPGCLEVHHIVPVSLGGSRDKSNGLAVCPECHLALDQIALREHRFYHEVVMSEGVEYILSRRRDHK